MLIKLLQVQHSISERTYNLTFWKLLRCELQCIKIFALFACVLPPWSVSCSFMKQAPHMWAVLQALLPEKVWNMCVCVCMQFFLGFCYHKNPFNIFRSLAFSHVTHSTLCLCEALPSVFVSVCMCVCMRFHFIGMCVSHTILFSRNVITLAQHVAHKSLYVLASCSLPSFPLRYVRPLKPKTCVSE